MSGAACVIIIDEAKRLAAVAGIAESLFTMEMGRQLTVPPKARDNLRLALAGSTALVDAALKECIKQVGPPHDHPEG